MKLALIPAAESSLGLQNSERGRGGKQHHVRITKPFYLSVYEITQSEFASVRGRNRIAF